MSRIFIVFSALFVALLVLSPASADTSSDSYLQELQVRAGELKLASDITWLRLVHYKPRTILPGYFSQVDDPDFFLAADGNADPEAEVQATLAGFFSEEEPGPDKQHPQCRFVARLHWLTENLGIDHSRLPKRECPRFEQWRDSLAAAGVTLIYPAAYLNNPASMFGHTLLRIDAKGQNEETRLLAYGANYAAGTTERSGIVFAVRGIFGGYRGSFSIAPYYKLVTKYSDLENRDIWEYELDFNADEQQQLVRHLWELGSTYFDYYFFDENCSYFLLAAFEAIRPELHLTDEYHGWVIPSDTVRTVTDVSGLVKGITYRPSASTIIRERIGELDDAEQELAYRLAMNETTDADPALAALSPERRARVLELAFEYLSYRRLSGREKADDVPKRARDLLVSRSKVPAILPPIAVPTPAVRPEQGHPTARVSAGIGAEDGQEYYQLEFRPAYHDLLDPSAGYVQGAEIRFFDTALRHYEGDKLDLEYFHPVSIFSVSPRDRFFQPKSFHVEAGIDREALPGKPRGTLSWGGRGGVGATYRLSGDMLWFTAMIEGGARLNENFSDRYTIGAGPTLSLLFNPAEVWGLRLRTFSQHYFLGEDHREQGVELEQRVTLTKELMMRATAGHSIRWGDYRNKLELSLQWYF